MTEIEMLKLLVEAEGMMDRGEVPWVRVEGTTQRRIVDADLMAALGLVAGQTITIGIALGLARLELQLLEEKIAARDAAKLVAEELS